MHNDQLVLIIQSLTPREKADFKRYLNFRSGSRTPKHETLFNILNKYSSKHLTPVEFTEQIQKSLKQHPDILKDIANIRSQLKARLLESLVVQNTEKDIRYEIDQSVSSLKILIQKKLFSVASLEIKNIKKKAENYDFNKQMVYLIDLELYILGCKSSKNQTIVLQKLIEQQQHYLALHHLEINLNNLHRSLNLLAVKSMFADKKAHLLALEAIGEHTSLQNLNIELYEKQKNLHIVNYYYCIKNLYYRCIGEPEIAFRFSEKLILFFETHKDLRNQFENYYLNALCVFGKSCSANKKHDILNNVIAKIKHLYSTKENYSTYETLCDLGIVHYIETAQYEKAIEISEMIDTNWQKLTAKTIDAKLLWYSLANATLYFILENNEQLHYWLNKGLNISRPKKGRNFYLALRQLELIYLFNNKDFLMLKEKIETYQKTLEYNKSYNEFEKVVLQHLRKGYNIHNSSKNLNLKKSEKDELIHQNFESLKANLLTFQLKVLPLNHENILFWCESRLQQKSLKTIFENHYAETLELVA